MIRLGLFLFFILINSSFANVLSPNREAKPWILEGIVIDSLLGESPQDSTLQMFLDSSKIQVDDYGSFNISIKDQGEYTLFIRSTYYENRKYRISTIAKKKNIFLTVKLSKKIKEEKDIMRDSIVGAKWRIVGFIIDDVEELTIDIANIEFDNKPIKLSNQGGFEFTTSWSGEHIISVKKDGYKPFQKSIIISKDAVTYFIVLRLTPLGKKATKRTISVTAKRMPMHSTAKLAANTVTRKDIKRATAILNDPVRLLHTMPGVVSTSDANARPIVRGGDVLELRSDLDGLALLEPYHFGGVKSIFNADAVDKMTLYRDDMPAKFHNALSGILAVESRKPLKEKEFDLNFDLNLLQYNAFMNIPLYKDKVGLNITSQGSYYDWFIDNVVGSFLEDRDKQYLDFFQMPDYQDYSVGLDFKLGNNTTLFINNLYSLDQFYAIDPDSEFVYAVKYADGFDSTVIERMDDRNAYYNYNYTPLRERYNSDSGEYYSEIHSKLMDSTLVTDTNFIYSQTYNILYANLNHSFDINNILKTTLAWQRRRWDIKFLNSYSYIEREKYDVTLDQFNLHQQWYYSGKKDHILSSGLQIDYTKQKYDVELPRLIHEFIIKGSTNYGDYWGPMSGDSGFAFTDITKEDDSVAISFYRSLEPRISLKYKGQNSYANLSLYSFDSWDINKDLNLGLGLRLELSLIDSSFSVSPRLSAKYRLNPSDEFLGAINHYSQNNYEISEIALSESLRPEKVWHFSLGWTHKFLPWLKQEVSIYHKEYYDLISEEIVSSSQTPEAIDSIMIDVILSRIYDFGNYFSSEYNEDQVKTYYDNGNAYTVGDSLDDIIIDSLRNVAIKYLDDWKKNYPESYDQFYRQARLQSDIYYSKYSNNGSGYAQGIEYYLKFDPTDWWSGWFSLSLSRSKRIRKEGYQAHSFPLERPLAISLVNYYRLKRAYELAVKFRYMSGIPYTFMDTRDGFYIGPYNEERFASYIRFDLRISKSFKFFNHKCRWYTELWNAFNTPNAFLRDKDTKDIKNLGIDLPIPVIFFGLDFKW